MRRQGQGRPLDFNARSTMTVKPGQNSSVKKTKNKNKKPTTTKQQQQTKNKQQQRQTNKQPPPPPVEFICLVFTRMPGELP